MKTRFSAPATLPLLFSLATLAAAQQTAIQPPPIKMGLWQTQTTTTMAGMENTPMGQAMAAHPHTMTVQGCLTPDTWKQDIQRMQSSQHSANCTMSNLQQDPHKISFDEECAGDQGYKTTAHFEMLLESEQSMHGKATAKMTGAMFPQGMTMNMNMASKWVSSDCGDVKPGKSKVVH